MRLLLFSFATAAILALAPFVHAQVGALPAFTQTPVTEDYLRQLNNDQLRILRRALRGCPRIARMRAERDPCVTSTTDRAIAESGNQDLLTFHNALPTTDRYDETRSTVVWRAWLQKR